MQRYNPKDIETKWQQSWEESKIYQASDDSSKPKKYILEYFPYPSGAAMHVGHVRNYTIGDALARFSRMNGYNVLHPMGWDAFGLPAENYAIKTGISPRQAIDQNTARFKEQLMQMGFSYDWSREIDSTDPNYYRWTQWFFLLLFKKGLAYQKESLQWWCDTDKTVLANEQVEAGLCWRCGNPVQKKLLKQWFFKITDYAERLLNDLDDLDWSEAIKSMQRNWIGRSQGAEINFSVTETSSEITVFTTRPDTLFGATFLVLAPENSLVALITTREQKDAVADYITAAQVKSDIERQETDREKTGVFTGAYALNPVTNEEIPIWIADYVLAGYGTGAIMAVPAHDERDNQFAKKFNLPITRVVKNDAPDYECTHDEGIMINSGKYDGLPSAEAREKLVADLEHDKTGHEVINYRLRDWLISRQRYWGAPIPIIHCPRDGAVAVPEDKLPVVLPPVQSFAPSGDGRSPLANVADFVNTTCPTCGGPAERETDTMDGFACSSWYFLRFADPDNFLEPFDKEKVKQWLPVNDYIGGAEHAVMHLLYARFWTKVMQDEGLLDFSEPFTKLRNQGMILAPDGNKMSKSKGNTIEPGGLIDQGYGADSIRIMELFIGPWNQSANWSVEGMGGSYRFLQRIWTLTQEFLAVNDASEGSAIDSTIVEADILRAIHKATKKVSLDLSELNFNTAISAQMECLNTLYKLKEQDEFTNLETWRYAIETLLQLLAPFAPHIAEELWQLMGHEQSIHISDWPAYDESLLVEESLVIVVQVNGKVRAELVVAQDADENFIVAAAQTNPKLAALLSGVTICKTIYVPKKLVNFVV
ncbi:MAG: leucine--tRNA ligase [Patescibacteria group bacterium]|nr:leucine--tRNA ligase [Patescibacteria group bacterium]